MIKRRSALMASALAMLAGTSNTLAQQGYPDRPIKLVVPYPPGAGPDDLGRVLGEIIGTSLGKPVIIENRAGAGTNIAAEMVARAAPDGYTLMYADNGLLMFNEHLYRKLPFNPEKDFSYIGQISIFPLLLVANPKFSPSTTREFVSHIKSNPGKLIYASPGVGSPHHLSMELLKTKADLDIVHVPYRGAAPAMVDLLSGQIPFMFVSIGSVLPVIDKLKIIAIASDTRSSLLPQVPTLKEAGILGVEASPVQGLLGPAGMPDAIVKKLNQELNRALAAPAFVKRITETYGSQPTPTSPEAFRKSMRAEAERWKPIIHSMNIALD